MLTAISDGMVALLKEFYGRGPTRAKSYYEDDLVVCLLRGGFTRVEQTLLEGGRGASVIQQRMEFQELMRERFEAVIEEATGRQVIGFMSGNQQDPDMMCEVFVLGTDRSRRRRRSARPRAICCRLTGRNDRSARRLDAAQYRRSWRASIVRSAHKRRAARSDFRGPREPWRSTMPRPPVSTESPAGRANALAPPFECSWMPTAA